jgi:putative peptide zinc metalloprotease protein
VVVTLWVLAVVPLMVVSLLLTIVSLPRLIATAWASVHLQGAQLAAAVGDGDILGVMARALAVVALIIPILGIALVVVRLVRRTVGRVRERTAGRPVRRGIACLLAAALVAGLAWAWWPAPDRYRPVRPYEGGTVLDAVPAAHSSTLAAGRAGTATTIWPSGAGALPTADHPALALVLTPHGVEPGSAGKGTPPTWVFPFDRPLPPKAGDNQALAVNTKNGSVQYDVAFSLVWADGDTALNKNEAYAFASCTGCRTVAVAFQVVLMAGSVHVAVPQNLSVAANYGCVECVTYALATQLVVSVDGPLSDTAGQQLAAIWAELRAFGQHIQDVPLAELQSRLTEYEQRILDVVTQDSGGGAPPADQSAAPTGAPGTSSAGEAGSSSDGSSPSGDIGAGSSDSASPTTSDASSSAASSTSPDPATGTSATSASGTPTG